MARHWSETVARDYLAAEGYEILAENAVYQRLELDLVVRDGATVVFVEVKQRSTLRYGSPAEAIGARKLGRLQQAALYYLADTFGRDDLPVRFDAVLLLGKRDSYRLRHLKAIL